MAGGRKLWAVSIGVDSYRDARIAPLGHAKDDAASFHQLLQQNIAKQDLDAVLFTNDRATLRDVRRDIGERLARGAQQDDVVLIFFAGHGSPESTPMVDAMSRYLVLHDTEHGNVFSTALDLERDFVRLLDRIRARTIVVFLDCCFSGAAGGRTFEGPILQSHRQSSRAPRVSVADLELGEGRIFLTACDDWQVAREDASLGHGVFTYCLLEALGQISEEPTISVLSLYDAVATSVTRRTSGRQHPVLNGRARLLRLPRLMSPTHPESSGGTPL